MNYKFSPIDSENSFVANGDVSISGGGLKAIFKSENNVHVLRYKLPKNQVGSGVKVRLKLSGWKSINYVAIGYTEISDYKHIKAKNIRQEAWVNFDFRHEDLIWKIQNGFQEVKCKEIGDIRIFIKGEPLIGGATLELDEIGVLSARENIKETPRNNLPKKLLEILYDYLKGSFRDYSSASLEFMETGVCPMPGRRFLEWDHTKSRPAGLEEITTNRFAWHGLHPAINLLLYAHETEKIAPVFAARFFIDSWLENSFFSPDRDIKFTWYDHGTAERLFALIIMWSRGIELNFDFRFRRRLFIAIVEHARLLNSESFYAYDQKLRYHNHAWFQDAALIAASLAFDTHPDSKNWLENALSRFEDQLDNLIVRDNGFAIFLENSIGYHHGVQRLASFIGQLVELSGMETEIPLIARELVAWSDFLRYPDGRAPAQGDTFRLPPRTGKDVRRGKPWEKPSCTVLPKAGYAVVKGNHKGKPWMLCMFNTSLSSTHKHEDNCSITLWFDGVEWLVDPSFYSHEYGQDIPRYLRSAEAHNCISIKDLSFSLDNMKASLEGECEGDKFKIIASHENYPGVRVSRSIEGSLQNLQLNLQDNIVFSKKNASNNFQLNFKFSENVRVENEDIKTSLLSNDSSYSLDFDFNSRDVKIDKKDTPLGLGFMQSVDASSTRVEGGFCINTKIKAIFNSGSNKNNYSLKEGKRKDLGKVLVLGSCVTRDIFSHLKFENILYFARTSFISLASKPSFVDENDINIEGNFERRMIAADFDKRAMSQILDFQPDLIVIDFIDERFDIVEIGESRVTLSNYLIESGALSNFPNHNILKRKCLHDDWLIACKKISSFLNGLNVPVLVHRALWAKNYLNHDTGEILSFNDEELKIVNENNRYLNKYYSSLISFLKNGIELIPDESLVYSDFAHKWGRDYFHYSEDYYIYMSKKINSYRSLNEY